MDRHDQRTDALRLYGVPESIQQRETPPDRMELFVDQEDVAERTKTLQEAVDRIFSDPLAAAEFQRDPQAFLAAAGLPEVAAQWDRVELQVSQALGDSVLQEAASAGDVVRFVDRMQELGLVPHELDLLSNQTDAMGFAVIPVVFVGVWAVVAAWVAVFVAAAVNVAAAINAAAIVNALALVNVLVIVDVAAIVNATTFVDGPGGDNPDESADISTPIVYFPKLNNPHVLRLMHKTLDIDLLRRLASYLHNNGFGTEVTEEIVKRALVSVWQKYTTGMMPEPNNDQLYMDIVAALANQEVVDQLPELTSGARYAMLAQGFAVQAFELMVKLREPVRLVTLDFNPRDLLVYQKVLIIPTGGLYGLDTSGTFKARLEEYVRLGGICICMAQQHGYDFAALPGRLEGYGWAEDQSCHARSVVITAPHPVFGGQDSDVMDVSIDGFFTVWPDDAQVLLRRRINGQPALLTYPYGAGRVMVTTAYADWGVGSNQLTRDERMLMRDMFTWSRLTANAITFPDFDPDRTPFRVSFTLTNHTTQRASRIAIHTVDPDKQVVRQRYMLDTPLAPGETSELTLETGDLTALGFWSLDAELQHVDGHAIDTVYDVTTFLVNNFDDTLDGVGYKAEPISFSAVVDEERLLVGQQARIRLLIWNYAPDPRTVKVHTTMRGLPPETRVVQVPAGRRTEVVYVFGPLTQARGYPFMAYLFDENEKSLGSTTKGVFVYQPAGDVKLTIDKQIYRPGEMIQMSLDYSSTIRAPFDASFTVAITDPTGTTIFDQRFDDTLRPGIPGSRSFQFALPMTVRYGAFKVWAEMATTDRRLAYQEIFFTPALKGRVEGRVLNAITGTPIVGALVQIDSVQPVAVAPDTGAFTFTADAGGHWLTVTAAGYNQARAYTVIAPERVAQIADIYITPQLGRVEGFVIDMISNEPIAGARVTPDGAAPMTVGADGAFAVDLPRGERGLTVEATNYASRPRLGVQVYPSRAIQVASLFLAPTQGRIQGVARQADTGNPLPGAEILSSNQVLAIADDDGAFGLTFPTGQRDMQVRAPGYGSTSLTVYVPAGRAVQLDDVFLVPLFGEVTGLIYDSASRAPIAGARVNAGSDVPTAVTGLDGRFHLRLRAQNQTLAIQAIGYGSTSIGVSVLAGKTLEGLDLGLIARIGRIEGVVLSTADDRPIAGARVTDNSGAVALTDAEGRFSLNVEVRTNRITIEAPGHQSADVNTDIFAGRATRLEAFYLVSRQGSLSGRLVDSATGMAIAHGRVWLDSGTEARSAIDGSFVIVAPVGSPRLNAEAENYQTLNNVQIEVHSGRSSNVGNLPLAALQGVVSGRVQAADGSGIAGIAVSADQRAREDLPNATMVRGIVVDRLTGQPIGGARVQSGTEPVRFTATDGSFQLALLAGFYRFSADAPGYRRFEHSLRVDGGFAAKLDRLELMPLRGQVSGLVANAVTGAPIAQAKVWSNMQPDVWALTDEQGRYTLDLLEGEITLLASAENYRDHIGTRLDLAAGHTISAPTFLLSQVSAWVEGVVRDAITGAPIPAALVWASDTEGVSADETGAFRLRVVAGFRTINAIADNYRGQAQLSVRLLAGTTGYLDPLALFPLNAQLQGLVRNAINDQPLPGIRVWADSNLESGVVSDADGRFTLAVTPGTHRIQAQGAGYTGPVFSDIFAYPGQTTVLNLMYLVPIGTNPPTQGTSVVAGKLLHAITAQPLTDTLVWWDNADLALGVLQQEGDTRAPGGAPYLGTHAITGNAAWTDQRLRCSAFAFDNGGWGVLLRYIDEQNYYRFIWVNDPAAGGPLRRLERVAAGQRTVLAEDRVNFPTQRWVTIEAAAEGDQLRISVGGGTAMQVRDVTHAAGRIGLVCWSQLRQYFRSIQVNGPQGTLFEERHTSGMAGWTIVDAPGATPPSSWRMITPTGTRTTIDGSFRLEGVPVGSRTLFMDPQSTFMTAWGDNRLAALTSHAGRNADATFFPMPRTCTIVGTLRLAPADTPIAGARVRDLRTSRSAVTEPDGTFRLELPATDGNLSPFSLDLRTTLETGQEVQIFAGLLTPGNPLFLRTMLEPGSGEIAITLAQATSGAPLPGAEIFYGDPDLRLGGFSLLRDEGSREGNLFVEGPALLTGATDWADAEIRFEARCNAQSGWGSYLRYSHRHSTYRLFYLAPAEGSGGALITLARREGGRTTTLAETRRTHDPNRWYAVRFAVSGQTLTVDLDGAQLFQVQDTDLSAGRAGIIGWGSAATTIRNVSVIGPSGTTGGQGAWDEEPGFGFVGGSTNQVSGTISGSAAADVSFCRIGTFDYHFPVPAGEYRVELTMAEHVYQQAARRRFQIVVNGQLVEQDLDLFAVAGFRAAMQRSYTTTAQRGWLHLSFRPLADNALVNYIRIWRGAQPIEGEQPLYVVRCGATSDRALYQATSDVGLVLGGAVHNGGAVSAPDGTPPALIAALSSYLEGNIIYRLNLAPGAHTLDLFFAEHTTTTLGQRVFNVLVNGTVVVQHLDVVALVGMLRMYRQTITVQGDGTPLELALQGVVGSPTIAAIQVDDPANGGLLIDCGRSMDRPWLDARGSSFRRLPIARAVTDTNGTARLNNLPAAYYDLRLAFPGWTSMSSNDTVLALPLTTGQPLSLSSFLKPLTDVLTGVVLNAATGAPLADAEVWYDQRKGVTRTATDGRFRIEALPVGWHDISVSASGFRGLGNTAQQMQLVVEGGTTFAGTIPLLPDGFTPQMPFNPAGQSVITASDGTWRMSVPVGQRAITLQATAIGGRRDAMVVVYPSRTLQLKLALSNATDAVVDGRIALYTGEALEQAVEVNWGDPLLARGLFRQNNNTTTGSTNNLYPYRGTHAIVGDPAWGDLSFRLQARSLDDDAWGVLFRYRDEQNYYRLFWLQDQANGGPLRRLERVQNGTFTTLAEDRAPYPFNQWLAVRITAAGARLSVFVNERLIYQIDDSAHATGRVGLYCWNQQGQIFRDLRVESLDGQPLFVESFTQGRAAWTVIDAPGATPASAWEIVRPTGMFLSGDATFHLDAVPAGSQAIYAFGPTIQTSASDGRVLTLPVRAGDRWNIEAQVGPAFSDLAAVLIDAVGDAPLAGMRAWWPTNPRQVVVSGMDGRVAVRLPASNSFASPIPQPLIVIAPNDLSSNAAPRAYLPLLPRAGELPRVRVGPSGGVVSGIVGDAVSDEPRSQIEVFWGDANYAQGALRLTSGAWSGDPVGGVLRGPMLLTPGDAWSDAAVSSAVQFTRPGGIALLARHQSLLTGYRAVVINDPDRTETVVDTGSLTNDQVRWTRRIGGTAQVFSGTLQAGGTISGTFTSSTSTFRFFARRRAAVGTGPIEGEWVVNANGAWLRLILSKIDGGGFGGRCYETNLGGTVARIERWSDGQRTVLAEITAQGFATNQWIPLRFQASGNLLRLQTQGLTLLEATDPQPLPAGVAGLEAIGALETLFRQFQVQSSGGVALFQSDYTGPLAGLRAASGWGAVGGAAYRIDAVIDGDDQALITHGRNADQIHYTLGLPPGSYTLELAFCEHRYTANGARIFDVFINDQLVDPALDLHALVGPRRALLRRYRVDAGPAGVLIRLKASKDQALINHLRVWNGSSNPDAVPPFLAIRPGIGDGDPNLFCATTGWGAVGGSVVQAAQGARVAGVSNEDQPPLLNQRQGEFRYLFHLPPGRYEPELLIAELQNPRQSGWRTFDIVVNGQSVAMVLDVALTVGDGLLRLRPGAVTVGQDRLLTVEFVNRASAAMVNLLRVYREGDTVPLYVADAGGPTDRDWNAGVLPNTVWDTRAPQGVFTDVTGQFRISGVAGGVQPIALRGDGFVTLQNGGLTMNLPVAVGRTYRVGLHTSPATATFSGEIVDIVTGTPLEGAEVWYQGATTRWRSDETGQFRIPNFPITRRDIFARATGYLAPGVNDYVLSAQVSAGQEGRYRIFLTPVYSQVEGLLCDAVTGATIENARLWLGTQRRGIVTGADGRFLVTDFPAGQAVPIFAARDGYQAPGSGGHVITLQTVSGRRAHFSVFLQPTYGIVQSKVLDLVTGAPIVQALVSVDGGDISTVTDQLGQFRLRVPAGDRRIYIEAVGYISEAGHNPSLRLNVVPGKTTEFTLYLKAISGTMAGQVVDSVSLAPVPGALVYIDEGFSNTLTDEQGRYELLQSNRDHTVYVKAVDYASDREDGWMASAPIEASRRVAFNHMLRPTLQLVAFAFTQVPETLELVAGQDHLLSCRVRNTGKREGGALVRLIIPGFLEQDNTEWIAPGAEAEFTFPIQMPADAVNADHQEVIFELAGGTRERLFARVRGPEVAVEFTMNKTIYAVGDDLVLRLRITNQLGGSFPIYTRAQIGDVTRISPLQTLTSTLEIEHTVPVDAGRSKIFFGVYLETGRSLYLNALYVPRTNDILSIVSDRQVYDMGTTVALAVALTESGRAAFPDQTAVPLDFRLIRDDGVEILPFRTEQVPINAPISLSLLLPTHMRQGSYLVQWMLGAGEQRTPGLQIVDVRGYKARFVEFLTDRTSYAHQDTVTITSVLDVSHGLAYRLDLHLHDLEGRVIAEASQPLELPIGRSTFTLTLPFSSTLAGYHQIRYVLYALPEGSDPLIVTGAIQGVDVEGPTVLAVNTDRRRYRPGDPVHVVVTTRGEATVTLRLRWDTGQIAWEESVVLEETRTLTYDLIAPAEGAQRLEAVLIGDTTSRLSAPALVRS